MLQKSLDSVFEPALHSNGEKAKQELQRYCYRLTSKNRGSGADGNPGGEQSHVAIIPIVSRGAVLLLNSYLVQ